MSPCHCHTALYDVITSLTRHGCNYQNCTFSWFCSSRTRNSKLWFPPPPTHARKHTHSVILPFIRFALFGFLSNGRSFWTILCFFFVILLSNFKVPHYHYVQIILWLEWYLIIGLEDFPNAADLSSPIPDNTRTILTLACPQIPFLVSEEKEQMKIAPPHAIRAHVGTGIAPIILGFDERWVVDGRLRGPGCVIHGERAAVSTK